MKRILISNLDSAKPTTLRAVWKAFAMPCHYCAAQGAGSGLQGDLTA